MKGVFIALLLWGFAAGLYVAVERAGRDQARAGHDHAVRAALVHPVEPTWH
jgi:hypothetical protein